MYRFNPMIFNPLWMDEVELDTGNPLFKMVL